MLEQTTIGEVNYLLAAESDSSESEAWLLKESGQADAETIYEFVEDDAELSAISKVFAEMLEDYDIQL